MPYDKLVDSEQLDNDLTSVADAIRSRGGTASPLSFPNGMIAAIENISGGEEMIIPIGTYETEAYAKFVPTGGKYGKIDKIGGKTMPWNQLVRNGNFPSTTNWSSHYGDSGNGTLAATNNTLKYTVTTVSPNRYGNSLVQSIPNAIPYTHEVFASCKVKFPRRCKIRIDIFEASSPYLPTFISDFKTCEANTWTEASYILDSNGINRDGKSLVVCLQEGDVLQVGDVIEVQDVRIIDLTQIFGQGYEPSSVDDERIKFFEKYADSHPQYNAGALVSADVESIVATYSNNAVMQTIPIPTAVRNLTGYGWSAGNVCNSIERSTNGWQYVQRVASADLSDLSWTTAGTGSDVTTLTTDDIQNGKAAATQLIINQNILAEKYVKGLPQNGRKGTINYWVAGTTSSGQLKRLSVCIGTTDTPTGTMYYELETPIITDITEDMEDVLDLFVVEAGGTVITENGAKLAVVSTLQVFADKYQTPIFEFDAEYPQCLKRNVGGVVEWLNPPMITGVEYRTTERFNGFPVYTKQLVANATSGNVTINYGIDNGVEQLVDFSALIDKFAIPYFLDSRLHVYAASATDNSVTFSVNSQMSGKQIKLKIKYTKKG